MSFQTGTRQTHYYAIFEDTLDGPRQTGKQYTHQRYKILGFTYKKHAAYANTSHDVVPWYRAFRPAVTLGEQRRGMRMQMRMEPPLQITPKRAVVKQDSGDPILTVMWRTRTSLWYETAQEWIPVMGFVEPSLIQGNYLYHVDGDTREDCSARQVIQMTERMRVHTMFDGGHAMLSADETILTGWTADIPHASAPPSLEENRDIEEAIRRSLAVVVRPPAPVPSPVPSPAPAPTAAPATPSFAPKYVLELLKRDAVQKGESCPISMTPFQECESTTATSCFHLFETAAIQTWLRGHTTCPVCKQQVQSSVVV